MTPNTQPAVVPRTPAMNSVTHGMRSKATLLPGEDAAAFQRLREHLFELHDPRTAEEAYCVKMIAKLQWRVERTQDWQDVYEAQHEALLAGDPGVDSPISEADGHRSLHRPMDCQIQIDRMDRTLARNRKQLRELQRERHQGLLPGKTAIAASYHEFMGGDTARTETVPAPVASEPRASAPVAPAASDSQDSGIEKYDERTPCTSTRVSTRGRLIGGFGRRRIFAEVLKT